MESEHLAGFVRRVVRQMVKPAIREGRIARAPDETGRVMVTVRSLTGDQHMLGPCPGATPEVVDDGTALVLVAPASGDRCWVAEDEQGQMVVVAWEGG